MSDDTDGVSVEMMQDILSTGSCANIIQDILGHKYMSPTFEEINYYNPSSTPCNLLRDLSMLIRSDIVLTVSENDRVFFTLSDSGYRLLDEADVFIPELGEIRNEQARTEETETITELKNLSRPPVSVEYAHPLSGGALN